MGDTAYVLAPLGGLGWYGPANLVAPLHTTYVLAPIGGLGWWAHGEWVRGRGYEGQASAAATASASPDWQRVRGLQGQAGSAATVSGTLVRRQSLEGTAAGAAAVSAAIVRGRTFPDSRIEIRSGEPGPYTRYVLAPLGGLGWWAPGAPPDSAGARTTYDFTRLRGLSGSVPASSFANGAVRAIFSLSGTAQAGVQLAGALGVRYGNLRRASAGFAQKLHKQKPGTTP